MEMNDMMSRVQGMMGQINDMQTRMKKVTCEGTSGGGMVRVTMNGNFEMTAIAIEKDAITPDDPEMLQDLILAASADARRKVTAQMQASAANLAGGLDLSSLGLKFPGAS